MLIDDLVNTREMLHRACIAPGAFTLQAHKAFEDNFWATKMNLTVRVRARAQRYVSMTR